MTTKNLWGNVPAAVAVRTPVTILREQAAMLGEMTNMLLEGKVETSAFPDSNEFYAALFAVAPLLHHYKVQLLTIRYPLNFYPVGMSSAFGPESTSQNEEEFVEALGRLLSSQKVKDLIRTLLAQVRSEEAPSTPTS